MFNVEYERRVLVLASMVDKSDGGEIANNAECDADAGTNVERKDRAAKLLRGMIDNSSSVRNAMSTKRRR